MKRRLFELATVLSLLLCVATGLISARGIWYTDWFDFIGRVGATKQTTFGLGFSYARIRVNYWNCIFVPQERDDFIQSFNNRQAARQFLWDDHVNEPMNEHPWKGMRWFQYIAMSGRSPQPDIPRYEGFRLTFPLPLLTLVAAVLPLYSLFAGLRRRYRMKCGYCLNCDYDLRATPNRCPECGTIQHGGAVHNG